MRFAIGLSVLAWVSFLSPAARSQQPDPRGVPTVQAPAEERPAVRASTGYLVTIEVTIAEFTAEGRAAAAVDLDTAENVAARLAELEAGGAIGVMTRAQLTTVDGSKAMLQLGERTAVATGQQFGFGGRQRGEGGGAQVSTTYSVENTGTMIQVRPLVEADGAVLVELVAEKSRIVPPAPRAEGADDGGAPAFVPARTATLMSQTTLRIPPGETVVVTGLASSAEAESGQAVILLSAKVADAPVAAAARRAAVEAEPELRIYVLQNATAAEVSQVIGSVFGAENIRVGVDERTNSLLVQCSSHVQEQVAAVLQRLDVAPDAAQ